MRPLLERLEDLTNKKKFVCMKYGNSYLLKFTRSVTVYVIGPHWLGVVVTIFVIMGGSWINRRLIAKISYNDTLQTNLYYFSYFMELITSVLLVVTALCNPGIVFPRKSNVDDEESSFTGQKADESLYCEICQVYCREEMKVKHCSDCGYCIERLDHHCPWMGQCVGRYNMKWFILFNLSWMIYFTEFILLAIFLKV